jgi:hypothetical protein
LIGGAVADDRHTMDTRDLGQLEAEPSPISLTSMTLDTWWPWIALVTGLAIIALGGVLFSPGVTP